VCTNHCIATVTALLVAQQRAANTRSSIGAWRLTAEMCLPLRYVAMSEALPSNEQLTLVLLLLRASFEVSEFQQLPQGGNTPQYTRIPKHAFPYNFFLFIFIYLFTYSFITF
jgi:hypothetical protein